MGYGDSTAWTRSITGTAGNVTMTLDEPVTFVPGVNYSMRFATENGAVVNIPVSGDGSTYTVAMSRASSVKVGDLFAFGEASLDCIVAGIEPQSGASAQLTLLPYAPEVFNAAQTIPPYTTPISKPTTPTFRGPPKPEIVDIDSDEDALPVDLRGTPTPTIALRFQQGSSPPLNGKTTIAEFIRVEWRRTDLGDNVRFESRRVSVSDPVIYIAPVEARIEYELRIRAEDAQRNASEWVERRHRVIGLAARPSAVTTFNVSPSGTASVATWTHINAPRDIVGYIIRWAAQTGVRQWDKMQDLVTNASADDRSAPVPTLEGTYAIKAIDVTGATSEQAVYFDSLSASETEDIKLVKPLNESPAYSGTKTNVEVRGGSLELERVTVAGDNPTLDDRADVDLDDWPYLFTEDVTTVKPSGSYVTAVADLEGVFDVVAKANAAVGNPSSLGNLMSDVALMSNLARMSGVADEDTTEVATFMRYSRTGSSASNMSAWLPITKARVSGRYFQFMVTMKTRNVNVTPVLTGLSFSLSAPARRIIGTSVVATSDTADTTITFAPAFEVDDIVPNIIIQNPQDGDRVIIVSESASKVTFRVVNGASNTARVARNVKWVVDGNGKAES